MNQVLLSIPYLAASVLFILSLKGLASQQTARRGNLLGMIGMAIAIAANLDFMRVCILTGARLWDTGDLDHGCAADLLRRRQELGAERVVLGTAAVDDPALVREAIEQWGAERIVVGIDARDGRVQVRGWTETTGEDAVA